MPPLPPPATNQLNQEDVNAAVNFFLFSHSMQSLPDDSGVAQFCVALARFLATHNVPHYVLAQCAACRCTPIWCRAPQLRRERCFECDARLDVVPAPEWCGRPVFHCATCRRYSAPLAAHYPVGAALLALRVRCQHCGAENAVPTALTNDSGAQKLSPK